MSEWEQDLTSDTDDLLGGEDAGSLDEGIVLGTDVIAGFDTGKPVLIPTTTTIVEDFTGHARRVKEVSNDIPPAWSRFWGQHALPPLCL